MWIIKPSNLCQGKKIKVTSDAKEIETFVHDMCSPQEEEDDDKKVTTVVVQKYLERPFLLKGRKFDIRSFVLVDQHRNLYLYRF